VGEDGREIRRWGDEEIGGWGDRVMGWKDRFW